MNEQIIEQIQSLIEANGPQSFTAIFTECYIQCPDVDQSPAGAGLVHNHLMYLVGIGSLYQGLIDHEVIYSDSRDDF